ncbi:hypothetical protein CDEST_13176 [Colletotrichum destructivum]|uniref:Uncharacterized protein n=1 Tax=Colletotrichum destructivum TaxID=34406 RepID=A0AAX4IY42_9PEZI|nr:hypothetical protein CDEST_13176 [Colletotrichum destructivum]
MLTRGESGFWDAPSTKVDCPARTGCVHRCTRTPIQPNTSSSMEWQPWRVEAGLRRLRAAVANRAPVNLSGILELELEPELEPELELERTEGRKAKLSSLPYKKYKYRLDEGRATHRIASHHQPVQSSRERGLCGLWISTSTTAMSVSVQKANGNLSEAATNPMKPRP